MLRQIKFKHSDGTFTHDDDAHEEQMRACCPNFFKNKHGRNERYADYRGFLIVRNTRTFTRCRPQRFTQIYAFAPHDGQLFFVADASDIRQAKRIIDRVLETGRLNPYSETKETLS